jgi:hypothetical protein
MFKPHEEASLPPWQKVPGALCKTDQPMIGILRIKKPTHLITITVKIN